MQRKPLPASGLTTSPHTSRICYERTVAVSFEIGNIAESKVESQEVCESKCNAVAACRAYTFWPGATGWANNCFLKASTSGRTSQARATSGVKVAGCANHLPEANGLCPVQLTKELANLEAHCSALAREQDAEHAVRTLTHALGIVHQQEDTVRKEASIIAQKLAKERVEEMRAHREADGIQV